MSDCIIEGIMSIKSVLWYVYMCLVYYGRYLVDYICSVCTLVSIMICWKYYVDYTLGIGVYMSCECCLRCIVDYTYIDMCTRVRYALLEVSRWFIPLL